MSGIGNYGKTEQMLQLMLIKSVKEGKKWGIFSPEQYPPVHFYQGLIHSYIGKSTNKFHSNQMSEEEYEKGMNFIREHFFYIFPAINAPTPDYINERFAELIIKDKIDGCVIDPFNQLDNDWGKYGRDDQYIGEFLSVQKRFALLNNIFMIIIAHPKTMRKDSNGNYPCPDVYDLAGGAMWNNKCDNILSYHRPNYQTDKYDPVCEFRSQKIKKQGINGIPGHRRKILLDGTVF